MIEQERAEAQAAIDRAVLDARINTAVLRDTMPTAAEHAAKMRAAIEWLDERS